MRCEEASEMLDAFADGELEPQRHEEVRRHVAECAACSSRLDERGALRAALAQDSLRRAASESLRRAIARDVASPEPEMRLARHRAPAWAWASLAACAVLSGAVIWLAAGQMGRPMLAKTEAGDAVSAHIRSLMASHLLDITTSDRHTVKPWFAGKVDFAPPVADFAAEGFPLAGGRLDYVAGAPAAAVVYNRRAHVINLFISPDASGASTQPRVVEDRGYHVVTWSDGSMRFCAVSDLSTDELLTLVELIRSASGPVTQPGGR